MDQSTEMVLQMNHLKALCISDIASHLILYVSMNLLKAQWSAQKSPKMANLIK